MKWRKREASLKTVQAWWTDEASDYHARPALEEFATE
jgi:hypothetical protein